MISKNIFTITIIYTDCLLHISKIFKNYFENKGWTCNLIYIKNFISNILLNNFSY